MTKQKLFLTGSLLVMAIAAVAATSGMKRFLTQYYYRIPGAAPQCIFVQEPINCEAGQPVCKYGVAAYQTYQSRVNGVCQTPLQPDNL